MVTKMKTIKIPQEAYNKVMESRKLLVMRGLNKLKPKLKDAIKKEIIESNKITLGVVIGIGATLLIQELSD